MALVLADDSTEPDAVGYGGWGLGFSGIPGMAVALDTYQNAGQSFGQLRGNHERSGSPSVTPDELDWLHHRHGGRIPADDPLFRVTLENGTLTVTMDGHPALLDRGDGGPGRPARVLGRKRLASPTPTLSATSRSRRPRLAGRHR